MSKKYASVSILLAAVMILAAGMFVSASDQEEAVSKGVTYLQSQSNSTWTTMALAASDQQPSVSYLQDVSDLDTVNDVALAIMAIAAAGENPETYPNDNIVDTLKDEFDGDQIGDSDLLNDTAFAVLALRSAGVSSSSNEISSSVNFIEGHQNDDGGWGWSTTGDSDTDTTAIVAMALLEADGSDSSISQAKDYVLSNQNEDGGFASNPNESWGADSSAETTSWAISMLYKIGEDPSSLQYDPISYLMSLQSEDGYVLSKQGGNTSGFTPTTTAYALIALSEGSYPVSSSATSVQQTPTVSFRIEGSSSTTCEGTVNADTALEVVENASSRCGYSYNIDEMDFGPYLTSIAGDSAEGMSGWSYRVNWDSPSVGAADYDLNNGDSVLWFYGAWDDTPMELSLSEDKSTYGPEEDVQASLMAYEDGSWVAVQNAELMIDGQSINVQDGTSFDVPMDGMGVFEVRAEKDGYINSNTVTVVVSDSTDEISMSVEITEDDQEAPEVGFSLSESHLAFGEMSPGDSQERQVTVQNEGTNEILLGSEVRGGDIFHFLKLDGGIWSTFSKVLSSEASDNVTASLSIPQEYSAFGDQGGNLIFWATSNE